MLHLPFGTLSFSIFVPQIQYLLSKCSYKKFLPPKLSIACTMSPWFSTYALAMDSTPIFFFFFFRMLAQYYTPNIYTPITSMQIPYRFIFAKYLDCMEGTHPMSSSQNETGVELIIFLLPDGVTLKTSPREWVSTDFKT